MKLGAKIGIAVLVIVFLVILFGWLYLDYPLPVYEGELILEGLEKPVEVYFDDYAVPHIYAENEHDLFFTAGYIAARERLFQMTVTAAAVEGRLAELFGESALFDDIYLRTWGITKISRILAENMHPDAKEITNNFCDGINAYIDVAGHDLPIEFKLLGIQPLRWTPAHVTGYERLMAHNLTFSWKPEIVLGQVAYMFGEEKLRELWPVYPEDQPLIVSSSGYAFGPLWETLLERDKSVRDILQMNGGHIGSNNWVISGSRTATGKPILANDPHLPISQPAKWYEMHLVGGRFNVSGTCLAGIPVPVIGQNETCAWGFTNLMVDDVDFYVETINRENSSQYLYNGEWRDMILREETFLIKGGKQKTIVIRETLHGPVISDIHPLLSKGSSGKDESQVVTMRWGGHDISDEIYSILQLNLMKNWDDFTKAARSFSVPGQNVVYADTAGNIGWRPFGRIPIRKGGANLVPVPGESSEWDWKGYVPFEEMPYLFNPSDGIIITANNKVIDDSYPYYISEFWEDPSRAKRIWELLGDKNGITVDDVKATQMDIISPFAREVVQYFVAAFDDEIVTEDKNVSKAIDLLRNWDGDHSAGSAAAAIFNASLIRLITNIYADEMNLMGDGFFKGWLSLPNLSLKNIRYIMRNGHSSWCDNIGTNGAVEILDELLRKSLREGVADVEGYMGPNPTNWQWGKLHQMTHLHPIGGKSPLIDALFGFNVGPFSSGGAGTTINNGEFSLNNPFRQIISASFRRIVDFSDLDKTRLIIPTGQSGLPKSPHYSDQAPLFNSGEYRVTHFDEATIKNSGYRRLVMLPSNLQQPSDHETD